MSPKGKLLYGLRKKNNEKQEPAKHFQDYGKGYTRRMYKKLEEDICHFSLNNTCN